MKRASGDGTQCAHEPIEELGAPEPRELERERVSATHFRLELDFIRQALGG